MVYFTLKITGLKQKSKQSLIDYFKDWQAHFVKLNIKHIKARFIQLYKATKSTQHSSYIHVGCIRLASLCQPRGAHSDEPLTRDTQCNRTITHPLLVRSCTSASPKWPVSQAGHLGLTRVSPWNDVKAFRTMEEVPPCSNVPGADRGRPGEANWTHS